MIAQFCKFTKAYQCAHLKWVDFLICQLYIINTWSVSLLPSPSRSSPVCQAWSRDLPPPPHRGEEGCVQWFSTTLWNTRAAAPGDLLEMQISQLLNQKSEWENQNCCSGGGAQQWELGPPSRGVRTMVWWEGARTGRSWMLGTHRVQPLARPWVTHPHSICLMSVLLAPFCRPRN